MCWEILKSRAKQHKREVIDLSQVTIVVMNIKYLYFKKRLQYFFSIGGGGGGGQYLVKIQFILELKGGVTEVTSKQSDTYNVAAMVGDQIQSLKNMYDGDAGPDDIIYITGEFLCWDLFLNMF